MIFFWNVRKKCKISIFIIYPCCEVPKGKFCCSWTFPPKVFLLSDFLWGPGRSKKTQKSPSTPWRFSGSQASVRVPSGFRGGRAARSRGPGGLLGGGNLLWLSLLVMSIYINLGLWVPIGAVLKRREVFWLLKNPPFWLKGWPGGLERGRKLKMSWCFGYMSDDPRILRIKFFSPHFRPSKNAEFSYLSSFPNFLPVHLKLNAAVEKFFFICSRVAWCQSLNLQHMNTSWSCFLEVDALGIGNRDMICGVLDCSALRHVHFQASGQDVTCINGSSLCQRLLDLPAVVLHLTLPPLPSPPRPVIGKKKAQWPKMAKGNLKWLKMSNMVRERSALLRMVTLRPKVAWMEFVRFLKYLKAVVLYRPPDPPPI